MLCSAAVAMAEGSSLYVSPANGTKTVGANFTISAKVNTSGEKVCVVKGTLVFSNLSCRGITVADGIMAQSMPTCSNPHFLLGIPTCTTSNKSLFSVTVRGQSIGSASVNFTGAGVIGAGVLISSNSTGGAYTIKAAESPTPSPMPQASPTPVPTPNNEISQPGGNATESAGIGQNTGFEQPAGIEQASILSAVEGWIKLNILWLIILILLLVLAYIIYRYTRKKE